MSSPIKRLMVYIDGTLQSITAAHYAVTLARALDAEMYAIYVINTRALNDLLKSHIFIREEEEEYERDLEEDANRYLRHVTKLAEQKGVAVETIKTSGTVSVEIKKSIREYDIDLLILGELSPIRSRREAMLDESERAMRIAPCSVLIVKDEEKVMDIYDNLI